MKRGKVLKTQQVKTHRTCNSKAERNPISHLGRWVIMTCDAGSLCTVTNAPQQQGCDSWGDCALCVWVGEGQGGLRGLSTLCALNCAVNLKMLQKTKFIKHRQTQLVRPRH